MESRFILREKVGFKTHLKVSDIFHSYVFILIFKREANHSQASQCAACKRMHTPDKLVGLFQEFFGFCKEIHNIENDFSHVSRRVAFQRCFSVEGKQKKEQRSRCNRCQFAKQKTLISSLALKCQSGDVLSSLSRLLD